VAPPSDPAPAAASGRSASAEFHQVFLAVAANDETEPLRQGIHTRYANAVETAGDLVGVLVEFAAGMQDAHYDFGGGSFWLMLVVKLYACWNPATIVGD